MKNVKPLEKEELDYIDKNYLLTLKDDYIIVQKVGYNRKVMHDVNELFDLNTSKRKIRITPVAIKYWIDNFQNKYSLVAVQNAINELIVCYQDVSLENIQEHLANGCFKIKETN